MYVYSIQYTRETYLKETDSPKSQVPELPTDPLERGVALKNRGNSKHSL